jgi:hypothetical protein
LDLPKLQFFFDKMGKMMLFRPDADSDPPYPDRHALDAFPTPDRQMMLIHADPDPQH